jgi:hypothetical protein
VSALADAPEDGGRARNGDGPPLGDAVTARLDAVRAAYVDLYAEAEAIAQSSIAAAGKARPAPAAARVPAPALRVVRRVPRRYRHSVPLAWRVRVARVLARR